MYLLYNIFVIFFVKISDIFYKYQKECIKNNSKNKFEYKREFNIVTYNIDGLFIHYNTKRMDNLLIDINQMLENENLDIICFQEVWHHDLHNKIVDMAEKYKLNYAYPSNNKRFIIGEASGLMVISRYPISFQSVYIYKNSIGACAFTNKSAQYLTIQLNQNKILNLINTHLQSSHHNYFQDFQSISFEQIKELCSNCPFEDFIVTGDFNLDYDYLKKKLKDEFYFFENNKKIITYPDTNEHLDHFFYKGNYNFFTQNKIFENYNSDHFPYLLNIELK